MCTKTESCERTLSNDDYHKESVKNAVKKKYNKIVTEDSKESTTNLLSDIYMMAAYAQFGYGYPSASQVNAYTILCL